LREKFDIQFVPENSQIRCLAHIVNLVVQKLLSTLNEATDPDLEDYYLRNKDLPFHYDPEDDPDLRDMEQEVFNEDLDEEDDAEESAASFMTAAGAGELEKLTPLQKVRDIVGKYHSDLNVAATTLCDEDLFFSPTPEALQNDCATNLQGRVRAVGAKAV
jgi:hypothetical protein